MAVDWDPWIKLLQSETLWVGFGTAALGSYFGALGGAWGIQRLADRVKLKDTLWKEVGRTNAAIEQVFGVSNTYLNLKEQFVRDVGARYERDLTLVQAYEEGLRSGAIAEGTLPPALGTLDLFTLSKIVVRIDRLEDIVMEELNITGRPRMTIATLGQSIYSVNAMLEDRNAAVSHIKASAGGGLIRHKEVAFIFGLPVDGATDQSFMSAVRGLVKSTDECIHFSRRLYDDLYVHGNEARDEFKRHFPRRDIPEVSKLNFGDAERKGLFPDLAIFADWETSFLKRIRKSRGRYAGKLKYRVRKRGRKVARWVGRQGRFFGSAGTST